MRGHRRDLILLAAFLALLAFSPAHAQGTKTDSSTITSGDENGLMSGGGEDGQFPEGTTNCEGSRHHHAHDYPGKYEPGPGEG